MAVEKSETDVESVPVMTTSRINLETTSPDLLGKSVRLVRVDLEAGGEL